MKPYNQKPPRIMTAADRAVWETLAAGELRKVCDELKKQFPNLALAEPELTPEVRELSGDEAFAIRVAGGLILEQLRAFAATIIPSRMCGCENCNKRMEILIREYNECTQAAWALETIAARNGLAGVASDRGRHFRAADLAAVKGRN